MAAAKRTEVVHAKWATAPFQEKPIHTFCGLYVLDGRAADRHLHPERVTCEGCKSGLEWHRRHNEVYKDALARLKGTGLAFREARDQAVAEADAAVPRPRFAGPEHRRRVATTRAR